MADDRDITTILEQARDLIAGLSPYAKALGMQVDDLTPERTVMRIPFSEHIVGAPGSSVPHGGVASALLDHACGTMAFIAFGGEAAPVTLDLRIDYFRASKPRADLVAVARARRVTRSFAFIAAQVHDGDADDAVAEAYGAFMIPRGSFGQTARAREELRAAGHDV
ncbi:MAG: PaaI family thioesterase [Caulobacterales bacterium]|nr:PaaI family thioesterase [Caulobacterales bacterium]